MQTEMVSVIPVLRIFSVEKAVEFYIGYLGFKEDFRHQSEVVPGEGPVFLQVSRDTVRIRLSEHYGDACPGSANYLGMHGIDAFHRELQSRNYPYMNPAIEEMPWKSRQLSVWDPFGNRLHFFELQTSSDIGGR